MRHWIGALLALGVLPIGGYPRAVCAQADRLAYMQQAASATKLEPRARPYHFGSQGPNSVYSNSTGHSNRLVPVFAVGSKLDLGAITGANSPYRNPDRVRGLYGYLPEHTLNPEADYGDQSELYRLQRDAVQRGVRHLFIVWFDGMDWQPLRAAVLARTGDDLAGGPEAARQWLGPLGLDSVPIQFGHVVTSPTHTDPLDADIDVDHQAIRDIPALLRGGYDARFGGPNPWTEGPLLWRARGYLRGQAATELEVAQLRAAGGVVHAYTDSSSSAAEFATGVKMTNSTVNMGDDGKPCTTLFQQLQQDGWAVGTVTSVPISHASPAAMYAHNVSRDDYQDLTREMLGLPSILQEIGAEPLLPGLDVVIGCGWGATMKEEDTKPQGTNARVGPAYITESDLQTIDRRHGGPYEVAHRTAGASGAQILQTAAENAARNGTRLFGIFGTRYNHLPYRTANDDYAPTPGTRSSAERYKPADLDENPTLAEMTRAALTAISADPDRRFALFVEAGDVDFALHDNNLDNAVGAIASGQDAITEIVRWVDRHSSWDESAMIITADHGHYLVIDDPAALAGSALPLRPAR